MDSWKAFDENTVTHSVAHHLVAVAELIQEYGYARVSDVARRLEITRGSVSVTLRGLKKRGLVVEDDRRFLRLSEDGLAIARSIQAKKTVIRKLLVDLLGVSERQADVDTCKIEHLISAETAERTTRALRLLGSGVPAARRFRQLLEDHDEPCPHEAEACPCCEQECLATKAASDSGRGDRRRER